MEKKRTNFKPEKMEEIACAVMCFDRPQFFAPVLDSLKANVLANEIPWYFYLDGAKAQKKNLYVGDPQGNKKVFNLLKKAESEGFKFNLFCANYNYGIARMKQKMHQLFDTYDFIIFFEDDMIVSPYYINLIYNMHKQFPNDIVYAPDKNKRRKSVNHKLNQVAFKREHLWGYGMPKSVFLKIKDKYNSYCTDTGDIYKRRPHLFLKEKYKIRLSSHDSALCTFYKEKGAREVLTLIPRGRYIGRKGTNFRPENFDKAGFAEEWEYVFPEDEHLTEFEVMNG